MKRRSANKTTLNRTLEHTRKTKRKKDVSVHGQNSITTSISTHPCVSVVPAWIEVVWHGVKSQWSTYLAFQNCLWDGFFCSGNASYILKRTFVANPFCFFRHPHNLTSTWAWWKEDVLPSTEPNDKMNDRTGNNPEQAVKQEPKPLSQEARKDRKYAAHCEVTWVRRRVGKSGKTNKKLETY